MPVFTILVILAAILLWLLLSPLFSKIGGSVIRKIRNIFQRERKTKMSKKKENNTNSWIVGAVIAAVIIIIGLIILSMSITKVPAGYVGVKYNMNGGVEGDVLDQGWHFKSPTVKVTLYTVGIEQSYLTSGKNGDSPDNDSFSASSSEGKSIQIDLTYTYNYQHDKVSEVFTKFKGQSGKTVRDSFIKPNIISWTKEVIARYKVSDVLGEKRADVNAALTKYLADKFDPYGISISNVSMINASVDKETQKAINSKIQAQQKAETQAIKNQTAIDKAEADAKVKKTKAKAEAEANKKLSSSITNELIRMKEAEARYKHGWVTVQGADAVVKDDSEK